MRIERLRIHNFRRFRDVDIELPDGVTALVGRNGAGKSTLLEAIGWCLYGHDAARTEKDLIKRHGAAPGDDVRVHLAFRFAGQTYEVTRELLGKPQSHVASVKVDEKVVVPSGAQSHRETTTYVSRLFHMDREAFFTSLVARQRELAALTDAKPADRKKVLIGLLRLDAVDSAIGEARSRKRDLRARMDGMRLAMREVAPLRAAVEAARVACETHRAQLVETEARIASLVDEVEDARSRRESSRKVAEEHARLVAQLDLARERLTNHATERARREAELARAELAAAEAEKLAPALEALLPARAEVERLVALRIRAEELARVHVALAQADAEAAAARAAAIEADALAPRLADLPVARASCDRLVALRARHDELGRARASLAHADAEVAGARAEAEAASAEVTRLAAVRSMVARVAEKRAELDAALGVAQAELQSLLPEQQATARELARVELHRDGAMKLGRDSECPTCLRPLEDHHESLLVSFTAAITEMRGRLAAMEPRIAAARAQETAARQQIADLAAREVELRAKVERHAREEARRDAASERAAAAHARAEQLRAQVATLGAESFEPAALVAAQALVEELEEARERVVKLRALAQSAAPARAEQLRAQAVALGAEPFDPAALRVAQKRLAELEAIQTRHTRLLADADRAAEAKLALAAARGAEAAAQQDVASRAGVIDALRFDARAHASLEGAAAAAEGRLAESRLVRERVAGEVVRAQEAESRAAVELAHQMQLAATLGEVEARVRLLEKLAGERDQGLLPEFKDHLIGRIRPVLSLVAGRMFRDLTDGRYHDLAVDEEYGLRVHEDGASFTLERYSGGEGDLANLCLRLAVSQVVAERAGSEGFGFLALDEVFGSQDEGRKANILRALAALSGRFRQILLVTHISDVKEAVEHVLRVESLDDGTSRVIVEG